MQKEDLEIIMRAVLHGGDDSIILNSDDPFLIILYRIFCFAFLISRNKEESKVCLRIKKSIIFTRNLPITNIKIVTTTREDLCGYHYIIMRNKIILIEYKDIFDSLDKIYSILKENY